MSGELRLQEMDRAGIALQVLSHNSPATQNLAAARAVPMAQSVNDRLHRIVRSHPDRFAAFAALPTDDPAAAADELERTVTTLHFKGAMLHGRSSGEWLDHPRFRPIFERAAALDVPIYLHPSNPHPDVVRAYYEDYAQDHPMLVRAAWGYTVETATQAIRLVLSNVFNKYPNLKIVLGHLGETLPFLLERIDELLARNPKVRTFVPPGVLPPFLRNDERQFFHPGTVVLDHGTGRRPRLVLGRLAVCRERQGRRLDGPRCR